MVNKFAITKRLNGTEESVQYFQCIIFCKVRSPFRARWLSKKNFALKKHAYKRSNAKVETKTGRLCHILQHSLITQSILQCKIIFRWGIWRQFWPGGEGEILNETISCCLIKTSESKYSIDSFMFSFIEGSSVINDLCRNLTISYISWQDRLAESIFSNLFQKRETSVFFGLRHAIHLPREMRNEIIQTLRSERVAFWLTWMISNEDFYYNILKFSSSFLNIIEAWTYSTLKCSSG